MLQLTTLPNTPTLFGVSLELYYILLVLGVPTFFIWRWLLKKFIKVDRSRKVATWVATLLTTPLLYIGISMLLIFGMNYHPTDDFNQEKWHSEKETRYQLSEDIIDSEMLIGKTKLEVRQILGDENNTDQNDVWSYYLGFRPGFTSISPDMLDIEFIDGKVIRVGQHEN